MNASIDEGAVEEAVEVLLESRDVNAAVAKGVRCLWLARHRQGGDQEYDLPWDVVSIIWRFLGRRTCGSLEVHYKTTLGFFKRPAYYMSLPHPPTRDRRVAVICDSPEELDEAESLGCTPFDITDCLHMLETKSSSAMKSWVKSFKGVVCRNLILRRLPLQIFRRAKRAPVVYQAGSLGGVVDRLCKRVKMVPEGCGSCVVGSLGVADGITDRMLVDNVMCVARSVLSNESRVEWVAVKTSYGPVEYVYRDLKGVEQPFTQSKGLDRRRRHAQRAAGTELAMASFAKAVSEGDLSSAQSLMKMSHLVERFLNETRPPPLVTAARRGDVQMMKLFVKSPLLDPQQGTSALTACLSHSHLEPFLVIASSHRVPVLPVLAKCLQHPLSTMLFKAAVRGRQLTAAHWQHVATRAEPTPHATHLMCTAGMPPSLLPMLPTAQCYVSHPCPALILAAVALHRNGVPSSAGDVVVQYTGTRPPVGTWATEKARLAIREAKEIPEEEYYNSHEELMEEYRQDDVAFHLELARGSRWGERHTTKRLGMGVRPRVNKVVYQTKVEREMKFPSEVPFEGACKTQQGLSYLSALSK